MTIEPVLYHPVRNTHAAADAVDLQVDLDVVPVTLVARGTGRRLERDRLAAVELFVIVRPAAVALRKNIRLHDAVAAAHGPIFRDADQVHRQAAVARVDRPVVLQGHARRPGAVHEVGLDVGGEPIVGQRGVLPVLIAEHVKLVRMVTRR